MKKDHFNFSEIPFHFLIVKGMCVGLLLFSQSLVSNSFNPWIEGVYSERRNAQMERNEIKVKKRNE